MSRAERAEYERKRYRARRLRVQAAVDSFMARQAERERVRAERRARLSLDGLPLHSPLTWRKQAEAERSCDAGRPQKERAA